MSATERLVVAGEELPRDVALHRGLRGELAGHRDAGAQRLPIRIRRHEALQNPRMSPRIRRKQRHAAPALGMQHHDAGGEAVFEGRLEGLQVRPGAQRRGRQQQLNVGQLELRSGS